MQRINVLRKITPLTTLHCRGFDDIVQKRYFATVKEVFPHKTDFPSRHIGPRKTDVVAMLDTLGFKVCGQFFRIRILIFHTLFLFRFVFPVAG